MAFSKLGAAITLDVQEEVINWLCDTNRPIEYKTLHLRIYLTVIFQTLY